MKDEYISEGTFISKVASARSLCATYKDIAEQQLTDLKSDILKIEIYLFLALFIIGRVYAEYGIFGDNKVLALLCFIPALVILKYMPGAKLRFKLLKSVMNTISFYRDYECSDGTDKEKKIRLCKGFMDIERDFIKMRVARVESKKWTTWLRLSLPLILGLAIQYALLSFGFSIAEVTGIEIVALLMLVFLTLQKSHLELAAELDTPLYFYIKPEKANV